MTIAAHTRQTAVDAYLAGYSTRTIADFFDISTHSVATFVRDAGNQTRPHGTRTNPALPPIEAWVGGERVSRDPAATTDLAEAGCWVVVRGVRRFRPHPTAAGAHP